MTFAVMLILGLFAHENAEFFNKVKENNEQGYTWTYVGKQKAKNFDYSLPVIDERTGEKYIYWEHVKED